MLLKAQTHGLLVLVGLRHEVGTDWGTYASWVSALVNAPLAQAFGRTDPAYALLNWLGANAFGGIYFVNMVCAILAIVPLALFCATRRNPALALLVAIPYLVTVVDMNYARQSAAIGLAMVAMLAVERQRILLFVAAVTSAALFHKAGVCLFAFTPALFAGNWNRQALIRMGLIAAYALMLTILLMWEEAAPLTRQYVVRTGDTVGTVGIKREATAKGLYSGGALVRIAQSVVAAAAFALIVWRVKLKPAETWLWSLASACVIALFALAFFRSTLADRVALFFLPLQLHAFSALPDVLPRPISLLVHLAIITGAGLAFWVWFSFGSDSHLWLPYQSILQQWL